jgi:hypothetical protein
MSAPTVRISPAGAAFDSAAFPLVRLLVSCYGWVERDAILRRIERHARERYN